jgi:hypothetical protein
VLVAQGLNAAILPLSSRLPANLAGAICLLDG